ncbi:MULTISPECIES: hypothetical protein [unclassified Pseudofrankia]|uniref:hypothetical protein n=1 Tax=unclassified Pseudofrankia TaxID=2994372 RepID=UPI0008DA3468|nr:MULTISPECIES: hypothetical protein [unclassified Pseudofrankia]MDT3440565.1 hypothetical protein [Pseudofrankia sp. BMG5.37]OHV47783.1 hypothetical protein BCD48_17585 [Pseudofrankia sp. BMG5.36]
MDAVRRGYLGLMLFIAALVLMPLLIVDYHRQTEAKADDRVSADVADTTPDPASPTDGGTLAPKASATPTFTAPATLGATSPIVGFQGVEDGQTLKGDVQITLLTVGDIGVVNYTLSGYPTPWLALSPPYLFAPHPVGWQTTAVPDGQYTLTATPVNTRISSRSVSFRVQN